MSQDLSFERDIRPLFRDRDHDALFRSWVEAGTPV